jgi:hypothetical protein
MPESPPLQRFQCLDYFQNRTSRGDLIIENNRSLSFDISDNVMDNRLLCVIGAPFIKYCQRKPQFDGIMTGPLGTAGIGSYHHTVFCSGFFEIVTQKSSCQKMIYRYLKKP